MATEMEDVRLSIRVTLDEWKLLRRMAEGRRTGVRCRANVSGLILAAVKEMLARETA
jgi:hypothetical protein